jgi:hypothetical protein
MYSGFIPAGAEKDFDDFQYSQPSTSNSSQYEYIGSKPKPQLKPLLTDRSEVLVDTKYLKKFSPYSGMS